VGVARSGERGAVKVLVVEDDPLLRAQLARALTAAQDFELACAAGCGADALGWTGVAELAVVDLGLPDVDGPDLIRALLRERPGLEVLVHTVHEDKQRVFDAIVAGASSYVLKGVPVSEVLDALRELRAGGAPMSPRIAREVISAFRHQGTVAQQHSLSPREQGVLGALEEGLSYKEIAARLHLSTHTVHGHIKHVYEKLHATNKAEALTKAKLRGLL
jgi:DNA-binding NarL/FixJ family response regulator